MATQRGKVVFTNWFIRFVVSLLPALLLLIGISNALRSDTRVLGVVALVVGAYLTFRAVRSACVIVDDNGVVIRELLRTRHIHYGDLQRAATNNELDHTMRGAEAALAPRADGAHLVLYFNDGKVVRARSVRNSNHGGARPSRLVQEAVNAINAHIRQATPDATT